MLTASATAPAALWLLPATWLVHDAEEVATVAAWSRRWAGTSRVEGSTLRRRLVGALASTRRRFAVAAALVGCVVLGATVAGVLDPDGVGMLAYATMLGGYALHAVVHVGQALLLRGYVPGLVTAVTVVAPTSAYLYRRLLSAGLLDAPTALATALLGLALLAPVLVGVTTLVGRVEEGLDRTAPDEERPEG